MIFEQTHGLESRSSPKISRKERGDVHLLWWDEHIKYVSQPLKTHLAPIDARVPHPSLFAPDATPPYKILETAPDPVKETTI